MSTRSSSTRGAGRVPALLVRVRVGARCVPPTTVSSGPPLVSPENFSRGLSYAERRPYQSSSQPLSAVHLLLIVNFRSVAASTAPAAGGCPAAARVRDASASDAPVVITSSTTMITPCGGG